MIRLGGLVNQKAFGKFEQGKVVPNPFATAFIKEAEGEDHEVSMANNSLVTIIKMATELKAKMGENEKDIPAWIQDHITNAENFISQASSNYHEYGNKNENKINEISSIDGLTDVMKGQTSQIEGMKLSKGMAEHIISWMNTSPYGKKYNAWVKKNSIAKILPIAFNWGLERYLPSNLKSEFAALKAKYGKVSESELNEMGPNDIHFKQVMSFYDKGSSSAKKAVSIFVSGKTNANRNQIADDLGDMDYNEILDVVDHFKLDESEVKYSKTITKAEWDKKPKDYKSIINGVHYMLTNDSKYGTVLAPVMVEGSTSLKTMMNEASEIKVDELNPAKQKQVKEFLKFFGGKTLQVWDGIHGNIIDIQMAEKNWRMDVADLKDLISLKIRWIEFDNKTVSIGF
jgi:hypothetical protein